MRWRSILEWACPGAVIIGIATRAGSPAQAVLLTIMGCACFMMAVLVAKE
jgi:hypothetical protein